jgi:hypothetical protein
MWKFAKRYRYWILGLAVACLFLVRTGLVPSILLGEARISQANCDRIGPGMTLEQVEAILGVPRRDWGEGAKLWVGPDGVIFVDFDENGKVKDATFYRLNRRQWHPKPY